MENKTSETPNRRGLNASGGERAAASADEQTDKNVRDIAALEDGLKARASAHERIASRVGVFCGSMTFIWVHVVWFGAWIAYNSTTFNPSPPDPFPFTFLTLSVNLEAILLAAVILISQNQQTRLSEQRARLDLQINLLAEQETPRC